MTVVTAKSVPLYVGRRNGCSYLLTWPENLVDSSSVGVITH